MCKERERERESGHSSRSSLMHHGKRKGTSIDSIILFYVSNVAPSSDHLYVEKTKNMSMTFVVCPVSGKSKEL
jgi:hypothetical protein